MTHATPQQLAALRFPALPSVVRNCTPLFITTESYRQRLFNVGVNGAALAVKEIDNQPHARFAAFACSPVWVPLDCLAVDLTDATGRAHLSWALSPCVWASGVDTSASMRLGAAQLTSDDTLIPWPRLVSANRRHGDGGSLQWVACVKHLNPGDDTRLPDGSRWVDAEAMRLVALHVLGGAS